MEAADTAADRVVVADRIAVAGRIAAAAAAGLDAEGTPPARGGGIVAGLAVDRRVDCSLVVVETCLLER